MSKLELSQILGSSTSRPQQLAYSQDCLIYIAGSFLIFYNPIVDEQIAYLKHTTPLISCICVSPCERLLAVCGTLSGVAERTLDSLTRRNNNIVLYRLGEIGLEEPQLLLTLKGHKHIIDHIAFSPDSRYLVSISNKDGSMFVWDCKTGQRQAQNKNSKAINSIKFVQDRKGSSVSMVSIGRGTCKLWAFSQAGSLSRVKEEDQWILVGRTVTLNKKFATKQFVDICFWQSYILLLTSDGLLCMVSRNDKEQKLQKCIDLMITKTTSMDIYHNTVMCGGDNAVIKVIDLDTLTLARKFPKPPPTNKENISKDYDEEQQLIEYNQSEEFPQCVGVKTIGSNKFSQFIVTLYQNLTMFIWRPEPQDLIAMRSIITHRASITQIKILEQLKNDLTFISTISQDNTIRIWHIYKKCFHNRESIDLAQLIGIKRNAYCRNLTRIIYMESQKEVTGISGLGFGGREKSVACIAHREFLVYSLEDFQVVCHQVLDQEAVALQVRGTMVYIGLGDGKVVVYELVGNGDKLHKVREIEFESKIKQMYMVEDGGKGGEPILAVLTAETEEAIVYGLRRSRVVHVEKSVRCMSVSGCNIVMAKVDSLYLYSPQKQKCSLILSLKHQLSAPNQMLTNLSSSTLWLATTTSSNRLLICNFSPTIVATLQFAQNINDLAVGDSGQIILVGDYGDILVYRMQGNSGYEGMEEQVRKWMRENQMGWMDGSVWAQRRSKEGDRLSGSVVDSIRLKSSVNNRDSLRMELPNVEIKYKSTANDQSVFNPSDILKQAKQIYKNIDGIEKKINNSNVNANANVSEEQKVSANVSKDSKQSKEKDKPVSTSKPVPKLIDFQEDIEEVKIAKNDKSKPPINTGDSQANKSLVGKKRIFGLSVTSNKEKTDDKGKKSEEQPQQGMPAQFRNNLVSSIIHSAQDEEKPVVGDSANSSGKKGQGQGKGKFEVNYSSFLEQDKMGGSRNRPVVREAGEISRVYEPALEQQKQKHLLKQLEQKLSDQLFVAANRKQLQKIHETLSTKLQLPPALDRQQTITQFSKLSSQFLKYLSLPAPPQ